MARKKTSIYMDEDVWYQFTRSVMEKYKKLGKVSDELEDLLKKYELQAKFPDLVHVNVYENTAVIADRRTDKIVIVYFREDGVAWCEKDEKTDCDHVKFALSLPEVQEAYKEKGLKIPEIS